VSIACCSNRSEIEPIEWAWLVGLQSAQSYLGQSKHKHAIGGSVRFSHCKYYTSSRLGYIVNHIHGVILVLQFEQFLESTLPSIVKWNGQQHRLVHTMPTTVTQ